MDETKKFYVILGSISATALSFAAAAQFVPEQQSLFKAISGGFIFVFGLILSLSAAGMAYKKKMEAEEAAALDPPEVEHLTDQETKLNFNNDMDTVTITRETPEGKVIVKEYSPAQPNPTQAVLQLEILTENDDGEDGPDI